MVTKFLRWAWYIGTHIGALMVALLVSYVWRILLFFLKTGAAISLFAIDGVLLIPTFVAIVITDIIRALVPRKQNFIPSPLEKSPAASIIILNWNGGAFLSKILPPLLDELETGDEVIVVDNSSSDDSVHILQEKYPNIKLLVLEKNYFFSKGNAFGLELVNTPLTVFLNNDMIVKPGFLRALKKHFSQPNVFSVSSEIFLWDPKKRREETGRTRGLLRYGKLLLQHIPFAEKPYTDVVFWAGGGSSAYATDKLKELGGFSELYTPFYWEDVDLSYRAWKRGWSSHIDPRSVVLHKHQGSSEGVFSYDYIGRVKERNMHLFMWANITSPTILLTYFAFLPIRLGRLLLQRNLDSLWALSLAFWKLPQALHQRFHEAGLSSVTDEAVFKIANNRYFFREHEAQEQA